MQEAPTETLPRADAVCPSCGASAERGQLVCLECGGRIALDYRRPPSLKVPLAVIAGVLIAAAVAFGLGLHQITKDSNKEVAKTPPGKPAARPKAQAPPKAPAKPK